MNPRVLIGVTRTSWLNIRTQVLTYLCTELSSVEVDTSSSSSTATSTSLLDKLKAPRLSDFSRKRVTKRNPPCNLRRLRAPRSRQNLKTVTPSDRVIEFKSEFFVVLNGKLFCNACREEVGLKKKLPYK